MRKKTRSDRAIRVLAVIGTRPEAIKMAPVILALRDDSRFACRLCVTAQHRDMLDNVLRTFDIQPNVDLNLMLHDQTLADFTGRAIKEINHCLDSERPDLILIQGDTTTVFCTAIAALYNKIPVAHVEAGLRSGNMYSPWPEESNRVITSHLSAIHFAPTALSRKNLLDEGISDKAIHVTGNTGIDALLYVVKRISRDSQIRDYLSARFSFLDHARKLILVTGHRRENFGDGFENICEALKILGKRKDVQIVYPVHMNPNVREPVMRILGRSPNICLMEPLDYEPFIYLMMKSHIILTDSGGIQEEAPSLGKPVLVMRDTTERPEAVQAGIAKLVGTERRRILENVSLLLDDSSEYKKMAKAHNAYGDGRAARRIVKVCFEYSRNIVA